VKAINWCLRNTAATLLFVLLLGADARAEHVYPFQGHLNLKEKCFAFSIKLDHEAALNLTVERKDDHAYKAVLDVQNLHTPFFDMTTEIQRVVEVHAQKDQVTGLSGQFWSQYSLIDHKTVPELSGRFELKDAIVRVDDLVAGDFRGEGSVDLLAPHTLDASVAFDAIDIAYFLDWLSGEHKKFVGSGNMSGQVEFGGTPGRLSLKSTLASDGGYIEGLQYDRMVLQLQGIYPLVELTNSEITKTNGFSFNLDGTVDLSAKDDMAAQIASIKTVPLVNENKLQSEWVLKSNRTDGGIAETQYFMKKDKGVGLTGQDEYGVFGVERKIGF
jgi:hypothetical protein